MSAAVVFAVVALGVSHLVRQLCVHTSQIPQQPANELILSRVALEGEGELMAWGVVVSCPAPR